MDILESINSRDCKPRALVRQQTTVYNEQQQSDRIHEIQDRVDARGSSKIYATLEGKNPSKYFAQKVRVGHGKKGHLQFPPFFQVGQNNYPFL